MSRCCGLHAQLTEKVRPAAHAAKADGMNSQLYGFHRYHNIDGSDMIRTANLRIAEGSDSFVVDLADLGFLCIGQW